MTFPIGAAMSLGSSLIGLLGSAANNKVSANTQGIYNAADDYMNFANENYGDINSQYYQGLGRKFKRGFADNLAMGNRQMFQNKASTGVRYDPSVMASYINSNARKANEAVGDSLASLYASGMEQIGRANQTNIGARQAGAQLELQADMATNQNSQNLFGNLANFGFGTMGSWGQKNKDNSEFGLNPFFNSLFGGG